MQKQSSKVCPGRLVILATGGTIAGTASSPTDNTGYTAAQLGVHDLVASVPGLESLLAQHEVSLECEQLAQVDSKDMSHAIWQRLSQRVEYHLADAQVRGVVITHGTDTLEETAYLLHRVIDANRPVVLTAAMRPATSLQADGPQNLLDACTVALAPGVRGVLAVFASQVWAGAEVRKSHTARLDAFDGGDAAPLGRLHDGKLLTLRPWPGLGGGVGLSPSVLDAQALGAAVLSLPTEQWPRVQIVFNHAGADAQVVDALLKQAHAGPGGIPLHGLVVAGTGNCTLSEPLEAALVRAQAQGVRILRSTRVARGGVRDKPGDRWPGADALTAAQARAELMLRILVDGATPD